MVCAADLHLDATTIGRWNARRGMHDNWVESYARLDDVIATANEVEADLLAVSGDVFHTGRPSAEAVALLIEALGRLDPRTKVVIANGNHDQQTVVGDHRTPIDAYLSGLPNVVAVASHPLVYDHLGLKVALMPWLRVAGASQQEIASRSLEESVRRLADEYGSGPGIFAGHVVTDECTFDSGRRSSEVAMSTSVLEASVATSVIDEGPWSAARLGHIHKRQQLSPKTGYVGSPYKSSFGEWRDPKGCDVLRVGDEVVTPVEFRRFVVRELVKADVSSEGTDDALAVAEDAKRGDIVRFILDPDGEPTGWKRALRTLTEVGAETQVVRLPRPRTAGGVRTAGLGVDANPLEAVSAFLAATEVPEERRAALLTAAREFVR